MLRKARASDAFFRWALDESTTSRSIYSLPARNAADDPNSDPYATVLFSDIRPFLLDLRSQHATKKFRLIWMAFLGLHIPGLSASIHDPSTANADDKWSATHFAAPEFLSSLFPKETDARLITADAHAGVLVGLERHYSSVFGPVKHWGFCMFDPLEGIGSEGYTVLTREDLAGVDTTLIREIFRQCRLHTSDTDWDAFSLAFEGAADVKA